MSGERKDKEKDKKTESDYKKIFGKIGINPKFIDKIAKDITENGKSEVILKADDDMIDIKQKTKRLFELAKISIVNLNHIEAKELIDLIEDKELRESNNKKLKAFFSHRKMEGQLNNVRSALDCIKKEIDELIDISGFDDYDYDLGKISSMADKMLADLKYGISKAISYFSSCIEFLPNEET